MAKNKNKNTHALNESRAQLHPIAGSSPHVERVKHLERLEHSIQRHEGPIPSPEVFKGYREVIPDAPERIMKVFELDSQHTRDMQKLALTAEIKRDMRAQWMAFFIMIASLGLTAATVLLGKSITAGIITGLGTLFLALGVLFVSKSGPNKQKEPEELEEAED